MLLPLVLGLFLLTSSESYGQGANPFTTGSGSTSPTSKIISAPMFSVLIDYQRNMNSALAASLRGLIGAFSISALLSLLGLSLAYGFVHALSPGHGKTILGVWVLSGKRKLSWVGGVSYAGALTHVGSAIVLSLGMWLILSQTALRGESGIENVLRIVAGFLLVGMGLRELWVVLRARSGKEISHRHAALLPLGIGLVPCPISTFIMAFALGSAVPLMGIVTVLTFGLGLGTALFVITWLAWLFRDRVIDILSSRMSVVITLILPIVGSTCLIILGVFALPL